MCVCARCEHAFASAFFSFAARGYVDEAGNGTCARTWALLSTRRHTSVENLSLTQLVMIQCTRRAIDAT